MTETGRVDFSAFYNNRKVLVTGATGFIGTPLCSRLVENGANVYALSRSIQESTSRDLHWIQADLADISSVRQILDQVRPDIIFHFSGLATAATDLELVIPTFQSLLASTVYLLVSAANFGCCRFVLPGSLTEPAVGHFNPGSPYGAAKWASSIYGRMFFDLYDMPVVNVRPFMTYGPGQSLGKLVPYVTLSALRGESPNLSSGEWKADWIYVDDVVAGFLAAGATPGVDGLTIDLGSGELTAIALVVQKIIDLTGHKVKPVFGAQPDRPFEQIRVADTKQAYATLAWQPTVSLTEGLERTISWLRARVKEDTL
jgi:nucleoside-diphosphate-sugar epimerase